MTWAALNENLAYTERRNTGNSWCAGRKLGRALCFATVFGGLATLGCGSPELDIREQAETDVAKTTSALNFVQWDTVYYDDSNAPLHIAVTVCESTEAARSHEIKCGSHPNYALVGGGADATWNEAQSSAMLTYSLPAGDYFWKAASQDNLGTSLHNLRVYTIGMRLDGVNTEALRVSLSNYVFANTQSLSISGNAPDRNIFSSGFSASASTFAKSLKWLSGGGWAYEASAHGNNVSSKVSQLYMTTLPKSILERFGALEVAYRQSSEFYTSGGQAGVQIGATTGWSIVGFGGTARATSGKGRLLDGLYAAGNARRVTASSVDNGDKSPGYTSVVIAEARKVAGSHGLCSVGTKLGSAMDSCVAQICKVSAKCCNQTWDASCVAKVETVCGKSCSNYVCSTPSFDPAWWMANEDRMDTNCYGYAVNNLGILHPGGSHYGDIGGAPENIARAAAGDGLIPVATGQACPDNMYKVALFTIPNNGDYHWLRQNSDGSTWSHKFANCEPSNKDNAGKVIYDAENADLKKSGYTLFGGYFCVCSGSGQGQGRNKTAQAPKYDGYDSPWMKAYVEEYF